MTSSQTIALRKAWNIQHALLRSLLEKNQDLPGAKQLFINHHAVLHSAQILTGATASFQDEVLKDLSEKQMRFSSPETVISVIWILYHISRIEDAAMNGLIMGAPEIFHRDLWQKKMNSPFTDTGNEMTTVEIGSLSESLNLKALLDYRLAVGKRTQEIVKDLKAEDLLNKPNPEHLNLLVSNNSVREEAQWLLAYWGGHPKHNLLLMPATRHGFVHLNEIRRMLPKLRRLANSSSKPVSGN